MTMTYCLWPMACPNVKAGHKPWAIVQQVKYEKQSVQIDKINNTMKKIIITTAIVLGLGMTSFAQGGGLFQRGGEPTEEQGNRGGGPGLPGHGSEGHQDAPLGSGIAVLLGLGGAYLVAKKRNED